MPLLGTIYLAKLAKIAEPGKFEHFNRVSNFFYLFIFNAL